MNPRTHQLYVASIDGSTVRRVTAESRGAVFGDWSPDGSTIVYVAGWGFAATDGHAKRKADLVVIDMMTGAVEELGTLENVVRGRPLSPVPLPRFTPDGQAIVYTELRERRLVLRFVPAVGGERERLRRGAAWAAYSPDGDRMAFVHAVPSNHDPRWFGRQLLVAGADLGAVTEFALGSVRNLQNPIWSPDGTHLAFSTGTTAYVADLETGVSKAIALGYADDWLDDHTLIVEVR